MLSYGVRHQGRRETFDQLFRFVVAAPGS